MGCQPFRNAATQHPRSGVESSGADDDRVEVTRLGHPLDHLRRVAKWFEQLSSDTVMRQDVARFRQLLVVNGSVTVSYTHLRAHETPEHLVCRLLLEKK